MLNTEDRNNVMCELLKLAIEISETTKVDIFTSYSPHVSLFKLDVHLHGWGNEKCNTWYELYLDSNEVSETSFNETGSTSKNISLTNLFEVLNNMLVK